MNAHLFEGEPDARQATDEITTTRFRPKYRQLTEAELDLHDRIKNKAVELEALFNEVPPSRYQSLAMTALEEAVMWEIKALTS